MGYPSMKQKKYIFGFKGVCTYGGVYYGGTLEMTIFNRQMARQTDRQADRQTDRQRDRQ